MSAAHQDRQAAGVGMLDRGQVDDQLAGGAEQAPELLAQGGSGRDAEVPAERGDGVAAAVCRGGEPEARFMSDGLRHGVSDHVSGDRPRGARQAMTAADRQHAGRDYAWRGARCSILRSGDIAVRNSPAAGRVRVCAFVTSDGIGGTDGLGGTVPLFVTSDGIGGTDGLGGTVPLFVTSHGIGGTNGFGGAVLLGDGRGRVMAGPGSGWGAAGSGMVSSLGTWGPPQRPRRPLAGGRPERCDGGWAGARPLAGAQQGRRQLPAAAAQGGRYRGGPPAGTVGCARAEPPAASLPLLLDGMTSCSTRSGQGRPPCGIDVAGIHRVTVAARPGSWPGNVHQAPARSAGRGIASVMGTSDRVNRVDAHRSSGSPGKLAAAGGRRPVPDCHAIPAPRN